MRENECEELVLESSVLWGTCGWVVPEMKDQKLRCDEFVGEEWLCHWEVWLVCRFWYPFPGNGKEEQGLATCWEVDLYTASYLLGVFSGHADCQR